MQPSAHFDDAQFTQLPGAEPRYGAALTGPGRWSVLQAPAGRPFGILYTDDIDTLSFLPDPEADQSGWTIMERVRTLARLGRPAGDAFDQIVGDSDTQALYALQVQRGDLASLR